MNCHPAECRSGYLERQPERLVITGFRCCMAGYDFLDVDCWETAWRFYITEVGSDRARALMGELQYWVRAIRRQSQSGSTYYPQACRHLCRDECMALSAISAAQKQDVLAGCLATRYLIGTHDASAIEDVWCASQSFAGALLHSGQPLYPVSVSVVESIEQIHTLAASSSASPRYQ